MNKNVRGTFALLDRPPLGNSFRPKRSYGWGSNMYNGFDVKRPRNAYGGGGAEWGGEGIRYSY